MSRIPRLSEFPAELPAAGFWGLVGDEEHEQLDFKLKASAGLREALVAMAMTDGGLLVLGVDDSRRIVGCPLEQKTRDAVQRAAYECGLDVQLREVKVGDRALTLVAIPEVRGRIVTTPDGRLLRRVGSNNQPTVGEALARFVREREERPAEESVVVTPDLDDFDLKLVNLALRADGREPAEPANLARALIDLQVALPAAPPSDPVVLLAAALLFANDPAKYCPGATIQAVRRLGVGPEPGPTREREEFSGPISVVLDGVLDFVRRTTSRREAVLGARRERIPEYPDTVVREAVLNALAHRDYGMSGTTVDLTIWDDRLEIRSPGSLPGPITLDNIREEHYSRNRRIMRVLKLLGLVEEYGEGVDRMFLEMERRLMIPPTFAVTGVSVNVTLQNRSLISVEDQAWLSLLGHLDLTPDERRILVAARHEHHLTRRRVSQLLPDADATALLKGAVTRGLLTQVGRRGGARYVLSDEMVVRAGADGVEARSRQRQLLLDAMQRRGSLSTAEGADLLDERPTVVRHLLNDLVRARLASARGRTRARRYYPTATD